MCYQVICNKCQGITWGGCGNHVESALRGVPDDELCQCQRSTQEKTEKVDSLLDRAKVLENLGRFSDAVAKYEQALSIQRKKLGCDHSQVSTTLENIGLVYHKMGRKEEAMERLEEALISRRSQLGDHIDVAKTLRTLASVLDDVGQHDEALKNYELALAIQRKRRANDHPDTAAILSDIGAVYQQLGENDKALLYYEQALSIDKKINTDNPEVAMSLMTLGNLYSKVDRTEEEVLKIEEGAMLFQKLLPPDHPFTRRAKAQLESARAQLQGTTKLPPIRAQNQCSKTETLRSKPESQRAKPQTQSTKPESQRAKAVSLERVKGKEMRKGVQSKMKNDVSNTIMMQSREIFH